MMEVMWFSLGMGTGAILCTLSFALAVHRNGKEIGRLEEEMRKKEAEKWRWRY